MLPAFGLDIGEKSIKAVAGKIRGGRLVISSAGQVVLPSGVIGNGEIRDPIQLQKIIQSLLRQAKPEPIRSRLAIISLPESKVYLHVTTIPQAPPEKTAEMIKWDLASHVSEDIERMDWDWEAGQTVSGQRPALAAAITRAWADTYYQIFKTIGLKALAFDMESKALVRALPGQISSGQRVLLVDISARNTTFSVYSQGLIQFTSSFKRGGDDWTDSLAQALGVTTPDARELKHRYGLNSDSPKKEISTILTSEANQLANEIERTRNFYLGREDQPKDIEKIVLVGGAAQLPGLAEYLGRKTSLPVSVGQLAEILDKSSRQLLAGQELSYGTAIGLAIRGLGIDPVLGELNLVSQDKQEEEVTHPQKRRIRVLTGWVIACALIFVSSYGVMWGYLDWRTKKINADLSQVQSAKTEGQLAMEREIKKYNTYLGAYIDLRQNRHQWSQLLANLEKMASGKVVIVKLSISEKGEGRLIGQANSREDIVNFQEQLKNEPQINNVNNPLSNFSVNENTKIDFEITFSLKNK